MIDPNDDFPMPGRKGSGRWSPRPDGRKYGLNIHFNLLCEAWANPELRYVTDVKTITAPTHEELAKQIFLVGTSPEIAGYVERHATPVEGGWEPRLYQLNHRAELYLH